MKPWHDTPLHECGDGTQGPIAPAYDHPSAGEDARLLRCCACGDHWLEGDVRRLVHAWWSAGAYEGKQEVIEIDVDIEDAEGPW